MPAAPITVVLLIDHAFVSGGAAKVAFDGARALKKRGHRPIIFAAAGPVDAALAADGIEVVCLDQFDILTNPSRAQAAVQGLWNRAAAARLATLLAGLIGTRSVVHMHGWAKALSPSLAGVIARSGLSACYTLHEYFLFCPNGGFYNFNTEKICPLEPMSMACLTTNCDSRSYAQKLWRSARQFTMQRIARLPDVFTDYILITDFQADIVGARLPASARAHRISNPIEADNLGPKGAPASGDFLFAGRIAREKGPLLFAEAARRAGVTPVFAGDGPQAAELAQKYPEARLLGWRSSAQIRADLRAARALVFPSLWYEGQPLVVMEAKALATPSIVSDTCAAREEIEDGVAGLWFKNGDADALAGAITRLRDDALVGDLSAGAHRSFWADPPTPERHGERLEALYDEMIARRAKAAA